jgi:hypothetical protein
MTRFATHLLVYIWVGMLALWLTSASTDIQRNNGRLEGGFPFVNLTDNPYYPTAIGELTIDDTWNVYGFVGNLVVYGVILLTAVRLVQSVMTNPPRLRPSLRYLLPASGVAVVCCLGASLAYSPFPLDDDTFTGYEARTPTPEPAYVTALRQRWVATDATTGEAFELQFDGGGPAVTLRISDVEYNGDYTWITPERITLRLGRYIEVDAETTSRPCPQLPTVFNVPCQQEPGRGYPSPIRITPFPSAPAGFYPEPVQSPLPTVVEPYGLYQGIEARYQVVVTHTDLTLTAPTGESQTFTAVP